MSHEDIAREIDRLIEVGDEQALEAFVMEHFSELPEDVQGKMLFAYFQDAVANRAADARIAQMQEAALAALDAAEPEEKE